jgi:hypothetical protein
MAIGWPVKAAKSDPPSPVGHLTAWGAVRRHVGLTQYRSRLNRGLGKINFPFFPRKFQPTSRFAGAQRKLGFQLMHIFNTCNFLVAF